LAGKNNLFIFMLLEEKKIKVMYLNIFKRNIVFILAVLMTFFIGCNKEIGEITPLESPKPASTFDASVIVEWNNVFLQVERNAKGYRPGPATRALAYLGLSAYESCIIGMSNNNSFNQYWEGFSVPTADSQIEYAWPLVINASYEYLMPRFFANSGPEDLELIRTTGLKIKENWRDKVSSTVYDRSILRGIAVAEAVWNWSITDQTGHNHHLDPTAGYNWISFYKKIGDWTPTSPGIGEAVGGVWNRSRIFGINPVLQLSEPPLAFSEDINSSRYTNAAEIYAFTTNPTLENNHIAEFWNDGFENLTFSNGSRWIAIGNQVLVIRKVNLETALLMVAKLGFALNDASISCFNSKFFYNVERPHTYINRVIDPNWSPLLRNPLTQQSGISPAYPSYPSSHATIAAAGAETLGSIFGYSYSMIDRCHDGRTEFNGNPRSFTSFEDMANEVAWSRILLGVNYRMDTAEGLRMGREIGREINRIPWKK